MSEHGIHSAIVTVVNSISLANISQLLLQYLFLLKGRRGGVIIGAEGLKGGGERERYWDRMQPQAYKALHCIGTALLNTPSVTHFSPTFPSSAARFSAYPPIFLVLPFPLPTPRQSVEDVQIIATAELGQHGDPLHRLTFPTPQLPTLTTQSSLVLLWRFVVAKLRVAIATQLCLHPHTERKNLHNWKKQTLKVHKSSKLFTEKVPI